MPPASPAPAPATPPASAALAAVAPAIGSNAIAVSGQLAVTPGQTLAARVLQIQAGMVELALAGGVVMATTDLPLELGQSLRLVVGAAGSDGVTLRLAPEGPLPGAPAQTPAGTLTAAGLPSSAASALLSALADQGAEIPTGAALANLAARAADAQVSTPAQAAAFVRLAQAGLPTTPATVAGLAQLLDGAPLGRALTNILDAAAARLATTPAPAAGGAPVPTPATSGATSSVATATAPSGQIPVATQVVEGGANWRGVSTPNGASPITTPAAAPPAGASPLPAAASAAPAVAAAAPAQASAATATAPAQTTATEAPDASITALVARLTRLVHDVEAGAVEGRGDTLQRAVLQLGAGIERGAAHAQASAHEAPVRALLLALAAHPAVDPSLARAAGGVADAVGAQALAGPTLPPPAGADPSSMNGAYMQIPLPGGGTAEVRVSPDAEGDGVSGEKPRRLAFLLHLSALGPVMVEATAGPRGVDATVRVAGDEARRHLDGLAPELTDALRRTAPRASVSVERLSGPAPERLLAASPLVGTRRVGVSDPQTPPRRTAVALRYRRHDDPAPRITAAGSGPVADRILAIAREHDLPLREDPDLIEALSVLNLNAMIPPELYDVIAEVLAWAYRANSSFTSTTRGARGRIGRSPPRYRGRHVHGGHTRRSVT